MHESLAEVAEEVVVACLRLRRDEPTARLGKFSLHTQPGERAQDALDIRCRKCLNAETTVVESDAHCGDGHFRFLVKRERWRRVKCDQVPNQLCAAIGWTLAFDEGQCGVGAIHFEAIGPRHTGSQTDVVEYRANSHDFTVVVNSLNTANRFSEQPRTHRVIEEK